MDEEKWRRRPRRRKGKRLAMRMRRSRPTAWFPSSGMSFSDVSFNLLILSILSYSCRICFPTFWVSCRRARNPGNCCANAAGQSRRRICFYKKNTDVFLVAIKLFWGRVFSRTCDCIVFISWRLFCHRCPSPSAARCREGPLIEACLRHWRASSRVIPTSLLPPPFPIFSFFSEKNGLFPLSLSAHDKENELLLLRSSIS